MAPVTATATGIARQTIDDPELVSLISKLSSFDTSCLDEGDDSGSSSVETEVNVEGIVDVLAKYPSWRFQEQADLYEWIRPLNVMDAALDQLLRTYPSILLIPRDPKHPPSTTPLPPHATSQITTILSFLLSLLRNATSKPVFNSIDHLTHLLAANSDIISSLALATLSNLASPPLLHRQQAPELNQHTTALHNAKPPVHARIMALCRGWGGRGSGLSLHACVVADDSGHSHLPPAGDLRFQYCDEEQSLVTVSLSREEMLDPSAVFPEVRVSPTGVLWERCLKQVGGWDRLPPVQRFPLLAQLRLARAFHSREGRREAVRVRLRALICALHAHPSQDIMAGYFHAQPELCVEMVDLVRPTVSAGGSDWRGETEGEVPYEVKTLAVECLTALVARRDGTSGGLTQVARQVNVLGELGVGKGQYLGFLPTLIRYSLSRLNSFLTKGTKTVKMTDDEWDLDLGLTFLEASRAPPLPAELEEERSLEFIDAVLTLTSAVVSVPSGTAALTDCGLIPALVSTVALEERDLGSMKSGYSECLMKFITAQAIQILEGAIVTHASALTAFHELTGVDILVKRLHEEIARVKAESQTPPASSSTAMEIDTPRPLRAARRVLLFSIVNCLTVVFHQQETPTAAAPSGAAHLRQPPLTNALRDILDNVDSYGGVLAALTATLLSDVMNGDPQVVHHVHSSGLARSFLNMLMGEERRSDEEDGLEHWREPKVPAASELIMALPNVISALSLTEEGSKVIKEANPFSSLLSLFYSPQYAMPKSRCLLNEMTAIVGTGLDELMRHVPQLRPLGIKALVLSLRRIKVLGDRLSKKEATGSTLETENDRTCLMQYVYNMSQLLEQVLHNEEHASPFVDAGGLEAILDLQPLLLPPHTSFLAHISCLSSPATSHLTHGMTTSALTMTVKSIASHYDSHKLISTIISALDRRLSTLSTSISTLPSIPRTPLHLLPPSTDLTPLSTHLHSIVHTEWLVSLLTATIRAACQRSHEMGHSWGPSERDQWKAELSSPAVSSCLRKLSLCYRQSLQTVCQIRTADDFDERERWRRTEEGCLSQSPAVYRLRIVCYEGAVVRDGIEIDGCESVGGLEMGEIVDAYDRCVNSSGVTRYRTRRGWVSEQTRGNGREPIAEVLSISGKKTRGEESEGGTRMECGIADLSAASASVMARLHYCYKGLFSCLSRAVGQGVRSLSLRSLSPQSLVGGHIGAIIKMLTQNLGKIFEVDDGTSLSDAGLAMYYGSGLELLHSCLYEEKRERRILNVPLLVSLTAAPAFNDGSTIFKLDDDAPINDEDDCLSLPHSLPETGFLNAIRFVLKHSLDDMSQHAVPSEKQRLSRSVSFSFPPTLSLLRRLSTRSLIVDSQMGTILSRMKPTDLSNLFSDATSHLTTPPSTTPSFNPAQFSRILHRTIGLITLEFFRSPSLPTAPAHILHPIVTLITDCLISLEDAAKPLPSTTPPSSSTSRPRPRPPSDSSLPSHMPERVSRSISAMSVLFPLRSSQPSRRRPYFFEPSEQTIDRLTEMGFSRDHALEALESTESNRLEVAMEYALAHPPPSPTTVERRRAARDERRRQRESFIAGFARDLETAANVPLPDEGRGGSGDVEAGGSVPEEEADNSNEETPAEGEAATTETAAPAAPPDDSPPPITDERSRLLIQHLLSSFRRSLVPVSLSIIMSPTLSTGETEARTFVICHFLLDLCARYPSDRSQIVGETLSRLRRRLPEKGEEDGSSVAPLAHASVILLRALPRTRGLVLRRGMVALLLNRVRQYLSTQSPWPRWLPPVLLLLDVMAQPTAAPVEGDDDADAEETPRQPPSRRGNEFVRMINERSKATQMVGSTARDIVVMIHEGKTEEKTKEQSPLEGIPLYAPMLPHEEMDIAMALSLRLLRHRPQNVPPPSTVVHATLLLLARTLRSHKLASQCLRMGGAELLLSLPPSCRFVGHSGLVTVIIRHMLEDETTLRTAMESEIRSVVTRLSKRERNSETPSSVPAKNFFAAITPLICRDPLIFLKAAATSVKMDGSTPSSLKIIPLTADERSRNLKALSDVNPSNLPNLSLHRTTSDPGRPSKTPPHHHKTPFSPPLKRGRSTGGATPRSSLKKSTSPHTPKRGVSPKRSRKDKQPGGTSSGFILLNGTPANHVTSLLLSQLVSSLDTTPNGVFLRTIDDLEVLADLVLAVPACAAAIHRYRLPRKSNDTTTAVGFVLHKILPRKRVGGTVTGKEDVATVILAQNGARLLIALCARAGEGRRRVVAELANALASQRGGDDPSALQSWAELAIGLAAPRSSGVNQDANAALSLEVVKLLLEYGVCHALMRAIQKVKLEHPLASAVAGALLRPMEVFTRGSVIDSVEEMVGKEEAQKEKKEKEGEKKNGKKNRRITMGPSRREESAFADDAMLEDGFDPDTADRARRSAARRRDFREMVDGMMHLGGYDNELEAEDDDDETEELQDMQEFSDDDEEMEDGEEGDVDVRLGDDDDDDDASDSEESNSEDEDSLEDSSGDVDSHDDIDEEAENDEEASEASSDNDEASSADEASDDDDDDPLDAENEFEWGADADEGFFDPTSSSNQQPQNNNNTNDDGEELTLPSEAEMDEGWTRIESSGIGGVLLGSRRDALDGSTHRHGTRPRGFVIDAEAMIGNILRGSDIQMEALAEIEDTLGIRIMHHPRSGRGGGGGGPTDFPPLLDRTSGGGQNASRSEPAPNERSATLSVRNRGAIGSLPAVQQSHPAEAAATSVYASRSSDATFMEYAFNTPLPSAGESEEEDEEDYENFAIPTTVDAQLFPGGPAAAAHCRVSQRLHPLLRGVDLAPMNSLLSTARGHERRHLNGGGGGRERRRGDTEGHVIGLSGGFLSGGGGNIIRLNRGPNGAILEHHWSRGGSGGSSERARMGSGAEARWTDDGQPLDSTTGDFSAAFERVLGETIARSQNSNESANSNTETSDSNNNSSNGGRTETQSANVASRPSSNNEFRRTAAAVPAAETNANRSSSAASTAPSQDTTATDAAVSTATATASTEPEAMDISSTANDDQGRSSNEDNSSTVAMDVVDDPASASTSTSDNNDNTTIASQTPPTSSNVPAPPPSDLPSADVTNDAATSGNANNNNTEENHSEGEGVATSLATGLTLSPRSESSSASDTLGDAPPPTQSNPTPPQPSTNSISAPTQPTSTEATSTHTPNEHGLTCPPGMDPTVFNSLPVDMQREVIDQHPPLDSSSGLDPEALAALPEDMRREIIQQEQQERLSRSQSTPADPSNAEEMDNASFIASLAPDLREDILLTADEGFLNSLPPDIIAEAHILRERASSQHRRGHEEETGGGGGGSRNVAGVEASAQRGRERETSSSSTSTRRRNRMGKMRVDVDRPNILYVPKYAEKELGPLVKSDSMTSLITLMYLLSPVRPQRLLQKLIQNLCANASLRKSFLITFVSLLNDDAPMARWGVSHLPSSSSSSSTASFPPATLVGTAPDVIDPDASSNVPFRRRQGSTAAASIAANLPASARGSARDERLPPVVARRIVETLWFLSKNAPRVCLDMLETVGGAFEDGVSCLDRLLDLLDRPLYSKSSTNLEQILNLLESLVSPLSLLPKEEDDAGEQKEDSTVTAGKEMLNVPRTKVSPARLELLCSVLRLESCKDASFQKVNTIARRLCRVEANRACILRELARVAQGLGSDAIRDLKLLSARLNDAAKTFREQQVETGDKGDSKQVKGLPGSAVTLSTSSSELKLLRVLQTLHGLCGDNGAMEDGKKFDGQMTVTPELVALLKSIDLESLWDELTSCLKVVSVLEGVSCETDDEEKKDSDDASGGEADDAAEETTGSGKKLQNSVAGLLTRFLPTIEAFFVVNASSVGANKDSQSTSTGATTTLTEPIQSSSSFSTKTNPLDDMGDKSKDKADPDLNMLVGGQRLVKFVAANKVLLNALLRANPSLLEKGLLPMVQVPQCRPFLDFDVKRQWFKTQVRRLRQHASRRHGSLRLNIRRKHVFEDAFHQLRLRNAEEMRGRLHITFKNEEGVDAGGLSREFFGILAKEMFNPNYALFTSTEDGCTFQPNPNSHYNPDHLSYFSFVGRIVGKAVVDGFLLDAHFTRSLYKHMLGIKPTHHDMQAIDPDYYKNLKMILEYNLEDIGLDHLTFSIEDHSFGRNRTIDLIPNGTNTVVTEESKERYVSLVCQHRMTTAIQKQIKAYLDGFYELVKPELISIFTAKELELLISGMPDIDVLDLKTNTEYQGYKSTDKEITWFWNIMFSLTRSEKAAFLQFVTGSSKVPLEGFSQLQGMRGTQKFSIHKAGGSGGALVSAHTCFNALDLPVYKSEDEMRAKLLYAINEGGGGFLFA